MFAWIRNLFRRRPPAPLDVPFAAEPDPAGPRFLVRLQIADCLTRRDLAALPRAGTRHWWLRHAAFGFARVSLPRGDQPVNLPLLLPAGRYVAGVGRGPVSRRFPFTVASDGSLAATPNPKEATDGPLPLPQAQVA